METDSASAIITRLTEIERKEGVDWVEWQLRFVLHQKEKAHFTHLAYPAIFNIVNNLKGCNDYSSHPLPRSDFPQNWEVVLYYHIASPENKKACPKTPEEMRQAWIAAVVAARLGN